MIHKTIEASGLVSVVVADACCALRIGLRQILDSRGGFRVIGEAGDGETLLRTCLPSNPQILIVDVDLPHLQLSELGRKVLDSQRDLRILAFTWRSDQSQIVRALKAGIHGYLLKSATPEELLNAVNVVHGGYSYLSPHVATLLSGFVASPDWGRDAAALEEPLSQRETQVLEEIVRGRTSKEIARSLCVTARTIEAHRAQMMKKLNLRSVAALTKYAIREGLASANS
jgi:two-component system NarL family response regulator